MVSVAGVLTAPAPLRYLTATVWEPSVAGVPTVAFDENGLNGPYAPPSTENAISDTGSPDVGFDADKARFNVVLFVDFAPPSILTEPDGAAVSRYNVYEPEPPLLFCPTTPSNSLL